MVRSYKQVCLTSQKPHAGGLTCDITLWRIIYTIWDASLNVKEYDFLLKIVILGSLRSYFNQIDQEVDFEYQLRLDLSILNLFER